MGGNRFRVDGVLRLILILSLAPMQACALAAPTNSSTPISSETRGKYDLSGVWTGTSITRLHATPNEWTVALRCESRHYVDVYSGRHRGDNRCLRVRPQSIGGDAFQETGRIVEVPVNGSTRLWLRVAMLNHSSCLFNGNFQYKQMEGSYICFREESSFERGQWAVRRSY